MPYKLKSFVIIKSASIDSRSYPTPMIRIHANRSFLPKYDANLIIGMKNTVFHRS
jgi:hypothetical protein